MPVDKFIPRVEFFRFYEDGTESGSTPLAAEDIDINVDVSSGNVQVQLRFMIDEIGLGDIAGSSADDWLLTFDKNAGGYVNVMASSSNITADIGSSLTNNDPTTNRITNGLSNGAGNFFAGRIEASNGTIDNFLHNASDYTEHLYCLLIIADDLADADTLDLRIALNGGTPGLARAITPRITITKSVSILDSSGTPLIDEIITAGVSNLAPKVYLNTIQDLGGATELPVTAFNLAGTSITFNDPLGAPTGALFLGVENRNNGDVGWIAVTVNDDTPLITVNGNPSLEEIVSSGVSNITGLRPSSGALSIEEVIAAGVAIRIGLAKPSSGIVVLQETVASGVSQLNIIPPVPEFTPTTNYTGNIALDLARPGDIEDPATDRAIGFLHDAVEQLSQETPTDHNSLTDVTPDQHHPQAHSHASHTGIGADDHHSQQHSLFGGDHFDKRVAITTIVDRTTAIGNIIICNNTAPITITLHILIVSDPVTVVRSNTGAVTIDGDGALINGAATLVLASTGDAADLIGTDIGWILV